MEQFRKEEGHGLDLRWAFRPVPGLGSLTGSFPMAHAMGYFLPPYGLDVGEGSQTRSQEVSGPLCISRRLTSGF